MVKNYFDDDGSNIYLSFQPITCTFTVLADDTETIIPCKSKGFSKESIKPPASPGNCLDPSTFIHRFVVNLFIVCELDLH